jgi:hypothetical protein
MQESFSVSQNLKCHIQNGQIGIVLSGNCEVHDWQLFILQLYGALQDIDINTWQVTIDIKAVDRITKDVVDMFAQMAQWAFESGIQEITFSTAVTSKDYNRKLMEMLCDVMDQVFSEDNEKLATRTYGLDYRPKDSIFRCYAV